jgi:hypothetical protein
MSSDLDDLARQLPSPPTYPARIQIDHLIPWASKWLSGRWSLHERRHGRTLEVDRWTRPTREDEREAGTGSPCPDWRLARPTEDEVIEMANQLSDRGWRATVNYDHQGIQSLTVRRPRAVRFCRG